MSLSSSIPRSNRVWVVVLVLAIGLWVGAVPQAVGQSTKGRDKVEKLSPAEREWLEKEFKALRALPPEEQQRVRKNLRRWMQLPEEKRAQLQAWAQETADAMEVDPSPPAAKAPSDKAPATKGGDLAKANEILSHDSAYIEERVTFMLSEVPDFVLVRDAEGKPDPQSLARLLNRYIITKLKL